MPGVSVVIPVRNGARTIAEQLRALERQDYDGRWEVVIADNGSTDDTRAVVEAFRGRVPRLRIVAADHGVGINVGRNGGVQAAKGELILICDADDVVHSGWIRGHVEALREYDLSGGPLDQVTLNPPEVAALHSGKAQKGCAVAGRFLPYATGCNFAFRREVWESVGGFDEAWRRGHTETEFCWRAQLQGFRLGWAAGATVAYRRSSGVGGDLKRLYRSARALPRLYSQFRGDGMPASGLRSALRSWAWLVYRLPWAVLRRQWRTKWLQVAAWRAGRIAGSLRYRVLYP
jgi:glycosyltransferase involved in cell wall biosynthesis